MPRRTHRVDRTRRAGRSPAPDAPAPAPKRTKGRQYEAMARALVLSGVCAPVILDNPSRVVGILAATSTERHDA